MTSYGGQAVIEGVMMRSSSEMATAVRLEEGNIRIRKEPVKKRPSLLPRTFFFRGMVRLWDMIRDGYRVLNWSAQQQLEEEEQPGHWFTFITTIVSIAFAIALFKFLPFGVATLVSDQGLWFNLIEGVVKIAVFVAYLLIIGRMPDIRRVFQYHGAEHKAIACYEAKKPLTVKNCMPFKKEHKRCGTNFLFIVIVVSIFIYLFIPFSLGFWWNFLLRLALLPVIAGIAYEFLKLGAKWDNWFTTVVTFPGMMLQKLTTFHPDEKQMEVGIVALKEVL